MTRGRVALAAVLLLALAGCKRSRGERDSKGEHAKMGDDPGPTSTSRRSSSRDPSVVELGTVQLSWSGKISKSTGKAPPVGTTCTLTTGVKSTNRSSFRHKGLAVSCGSKTLYDERDKLNGQSASKYSLNELEVPGKVSVYAYTLKANDVGARAGDRSQLTVSTSDGELIVFRETAPTFRVTIDVDAFSAPRAAKPIFEDEIPPFTTVVTSKATLKSSTGKLPFTGKTCDLGISPGSRSRNCLVRIECGGKVVFGAGTSGYESCTLENGLPVSFDDRKPTTQDSDPKLNVDLHAKTAVLADDLANGTSYSATFALE